MSINHLRPFETGVVMGIVIGCIVMSVLFFIIQDIRSYVKKWPYYVNSYMDCMAAKNGLAHWACVSPDSSSWWIRNDDKRIDISDNPDEWCRLLKEYDISHPMKPQYYGD
jgi:hypothetical protein